jgi:hypothetical protein
MTAPDFRALCEELLAAADEYAGMNPYMRLDNAMKAARAALAKPAPTPEPAPALVPVPVSERLPGEGDLDANGRCWVYQNGNSTTHWLPASAIAAHDIPLPQPAPPDEGLVDRVETLEAKYETQRLATLEWGKDVDKLMRWSDDHLKRIMALEAAQQQPHQDKLDRLIELDRDDELEAPPAGGLKEEALTALTRYTIGETILTSDSVDIIRRALEALPE